MVKPPRALAASVLVAAATSSQVQAQAQSQFSADLLIGFADQSTQIDEFSYSDDDISFGLRGTYNLNQNIAFELAYQDYGEIEDTYYVDDVTVNDRFSTSAVTLGVKGILPLQDGFSLNGRVGVSRWDLQLRNTESNEPGNDFTVSDNGTDLYYGIGAEYEMNRAFSLGVEYTLTEMDLSLNGVGGSHEVDNLALYIRYDF